jgi:murein DD-endopeptidase MepM/ murein hydrolase activator NlpD
VPLRISCFTAILTVLLAWFADAHGQRLYKYQDADGVWVYTDRQPQGEQTYEEAELAQRLEKAEVRLHQLNVDNGWLLIAENTYFAPVQIAYQLVKMQNLDSQTPERGTYVLPERSETELLTVGRGEVTGPSSFEYQFQYIPGDPSARHEPREPYRLPFAAASSFPVSQAYPERITHGDPSSEHAIDFVMPVGSGVYAARGGVVIDVASEFFGSGLDMSADGPRANVVRVLHGDGTMSLYAHLNWNSIRVVPGQRVQRGEYLADSGNTGFTTGPHLHFVVQRNSGGAIVSVPTQFEGPAGESITLLTGDEPRAY